MVKADLMATAVRDRALKGRAHYLDADAPVNGVADPASDMWAAGLGPRCPLCRVQHRAVARRSPLQSRARLSGPAGWSLTAAGWRTPSRVGAGAIAWHIYSGRPLYEGPVNDQDILGSLLGITPLPFEEDPTLWVHFTNHHVCPCPCSLPAPAGARHSCGALQLTTAASFLQGDGCCSMLHSMHTLALRMQHALRAPGQRIACWTWQAGFLPSLALT